MDGVISRPKGCRPVWPLNVSYRSTYTHNACMVLGHELTIYECEYVIMFMMERLGNNEPTYTCPKYINIYVPPKQKLCTRETRHIPPIIPTSD